MNRRSAALSIAVALALAACGGSERDTATAPTDRDTIPTSTTTTSTTTTTTTTTTVPVAPVRLPTAGDVTTLAELDAATGGVSTGPDGGLLVADIGPAPSRRGTTVYRVAPSGETSTVADDELLRGASGNTVGPDGSIYQAAFTGQRIARIASDEGVTVFTEDKVNGPIGLVFGPEGGLFVADCRSRVIWRATPDGEVTQFASSPLFSCPNGITIDEHGILYVANFGDGWVLRVDQDGRVTELAELPGRNNGHIAYGGNGVLYVAARGAQQIYAVGIDGSAALLAGTGEPGLADGPALEATFSLPNGIAVSPDGALYVNQSASPGATANHPTVIRRIEIARS